MSNLYTNVMYFIDPSEYVERVIFNLKFAFFQEDIEVEQFPEGHIGIMFFDTKNSPPDDMAELFSTMFENSYVVLVYEDLTAMTVGYNVYINEELVQEVETAYGEFDIDDYKKIINDFVLGANPW